MKSCFWLRPRLDSSLLSVGSDVGDVLGFGPLQAHRPRGTRAPCLLIMECLIVTVSLYRLPLARLAGSAGGYDFLIDAAQHRLVLGPLALYPFC